MKGSIKTELNTFINKGENLIVLVPPAAPPPPQYQNSGAFNNKGIEFLITYMSHSGIKLHANYTFIHMKTPLPGTPGHNLFASATYRYKKWQFRTKLQGIFELYNETGLGVEMIEKNYQLLGVRVGYQVTRFLNLYLAGNNLLNQSYQINYGYPMPGINVMGGVNLKLVKHQ